MYSVGGATLRPLTLALSVLLLIGLAACDASQDMNKTNMTNTNVKRWYSAEQVGIGHTVFAQHCAACHGAQAQGLVTDWKIRQTDGSLPPPPLNGEAHAWHHPMPLLLQIIQQGGALYDGKMPGFADQLSETEQYAVIAWFQSLWNDEIYNAWQVGHAASASDG